MAPALVDDLIQETYVKLCAGRCRVLREFELWRPDALYGLLKTVSFSVAQDHFRASMADKRGAGREAAAFEEHADESAASDIEREVLLREISAELEPESRRDRAIFWL